MFEFIQLCIKLITLFTGVVMSDAPRDVRLKAYREGADVFQEHVMAILHHLNRRSSKQYRIFCYWQARVELVKDQAFEHLFERNDHTVQMAARSSESVNYWATKLGYEVEGV